MLPVPVKDQSHYAPEVVDPVGVVERHAPAVRLGRKTPQKEDARPRRQERLEGMGLGVHTSKILLLPVFSNFDHILFFPGFGFGGNSAPSGPSTGPEGAKTWAK